MDDRTADHPRFVKIEYFMVEMLGLKSRTTYYTHVKDKGWPQRVYPTGKPMLVYDECVAYLKLLMDRREPPPPLKKRSPVEALPPKRRVGRPAKARPAA